MPGVTHVQTTINGEPVNFLCEPRQSLLECLRDVLGMTGSKEGCNDGNCGACTVELDGRIVDSCLVLGVGGPRARRSRPSRAWPAPRDCTRCSKPSWNRQPCSAASALPVSWWRPKALLDREPDADEARIRHWLAGNLCRCTGYDKIVRAVLQVSQPGS